MLRELENKLKHEWGNFIELEDYVEEDDFEEIYTYTTKTLDNLEKQIALFCLENDVTSSVCSCVKKFNTPFQKCGTYKFFNDDEITVGTTLD